MTRVGDGSRGHRSGRPWFGAGVVLAIGATLALVLTDDLRWLRLAILAALWAALIGAFVAVRYRKQAATTEESAAKAQAIYELELEREIAARREFELEIEAETRDRVEEESAEELAELRSEIAALRESLQALFGGEVLWERVALTAQSTRMRSIGEEPRVVTAGDAKAGVPAQLPAGKKVTEITDRPTELITRIRDREPDVVAKPVQQVTQAAPAKPAKQAPPAPPVKQAPPIKPLPPKQNPPVQPPRRPAAAAQDATARTQFVPRPARPAEDSRPAQRPVDPPTRQVRPAEHVGMAAARATKAASLARAEMSRPHQQPVAKPVDPPADEPAKQHAPVRPPQRKPDPEPTRPAMERVPRGRPVASVTPPPRKREPEPPTAYARSFDHFLNSADDADAGHAERERPAKPIEPPTPPTPPRQAKPPEPVAPPKPPKVAEPAEPTVKPQAEPVRNPTLPPEIRDLGARTGGRRRRAERDDSAAPAETPAGLPSGRHGTPPAEPAGGRRRRADAEPPWQDVTAEPVNGSRHSKPDTNGASSSGGRRRAPEPAAVPAEASGSHAEGKSVSELLATYGAGGSGPRRRRRAED
ncbi:DUF6779 domain-containing protein [Saccharomonospora sp. NPDC046836]|uniref:DUF6779 domain-containing protein n=1 Tax=Saccharomonospora sp. NPDC046836 TaxID=3156921 RepID=UPI0033EF2DAD